MSTESFLKIWLGILGDTTHPRVTYSEFILSEFPKDHPLHSIPRNIDRASLEAMLTRYALDLVTHEDPKAVEFNPDLKISVLDVLEIQYRHHGVLLKGIRIAGDHSQIFPNAGDTSGISRNQSRDMYERSLIDGTIDSVTQTELNINPQGS